MASSQTDSVPVYQVSLDLPETAHVPVQRNSAQTTEILNRYKAKRFFREGKQEEFSKLIDVDPGLSKEDIKEALAKGYDRQVILLLQKGYYRTTPSFVMANFDIITVPVLVEMVKSSDLFGLAQQRDIMRFYFEHGPEYDDRIILLVQLGWYFPADYGVIVASERNDAKIIRLINLGYIYSEIELVYLKSLHLVREYQIARNADIHLTFYRNYRNGNLKTALQEVQGILKLDESVQIIPEVMFGELDLKMLLIEAFTHNYSLLIYRLLEEDLSEDVLSHVVEKLYHHRSDTMLLRLLFSLRETDSEKCLEKMSSRLNGYLLNRKMMLLQTEAMKRICPNKKLLEGAKNDSSQAFIPLTGLMDGTGVIVKIDKYLFELNDLFCFWKAQLDNYDRIIMPCFPKNPYTGEYFTPELLYQIGYVAVTYGVEIPPFVLLIMLRPKIMKKTYNLLNRDVLLASDSLRSDFFHRGHKYEGGNPTLNEDGKWVFSRCENYDTNFCLEKQPSLEELQIVASRFFALS